MQKENQTPLQELQSELSDYRSRAIQADYKSKIPSLPRSTKMNQHGLPASHLMTGFYKRLTNWLKGLEQLENPGGKPRIEKPAVTQSGIFTLDELTKKFENN